VVAPDELSGADALAQRRQQQRGAISLNNIKFQLQNNVTMAELKDAEAREPPSPRTLDCRIEQLA